MRWLFALIACAALSASAPARADGLSEAELQMLEGGRTVVRPQTFDQTMYESNRRLIGGLTYTLVDTTPEELLALLDDTSQWQSLLPKTKSATVIGTREATREKWVELTQAQGIFTARNTLHLQRSGNMVRFWLDVSRPHAIDDAWGFFRVEKAASRKDGAPRALLTFGVLMDTGPGLVRSFYEERLRAAMLNIPAVVRQYVLVTRRASALG